MNEEIKEILDKLKDKDWYEELDLTGTKWIELKQEETNLLLNYITNLQEENKEFKARWKDTNVIVENDKLLVMNTNAYDCLQYYKSRIEKAVDYIEKSINNPQPFYEYIYGDEDGKAQNLDNLLNILQGVGKDER